LTNVCVDLKKVSSNDESKAHRYITKADYRAVHSPYHFLANNELASPNLCYYLPKTIGDTTLETTYFILEAFDASLPRYRISKRLKSYLKFIEDGEWESETGDSQPPRLLLAFARLSDTIYAKRRMRSIISENSCDDEKPEVYFSTTEKLKTNSIDEEIWEHV
jgi:hypothetical protein